MKVWEHINQLRNTNDSREQVKAYMQNEIKREEENTMKVQFEMPEDWKKEPKKTSYTLDDLLDSECQIISINKGGENENII